MKKVIGVFLLAVIITLPASAFISGIAIQTEKSSTMQVYVNGKLYNKQPGKFVRIKSLPGLFHVEVKVLNPYDKQWYIVRKDVKVQNGYELYCKMVFTRGKHPQLVEVKNYPVYSRYFLNPVLYNKHPIT